jgi:hypothetical protein
MFLLAAESTVMILPDVTTILQDGRATLRVMTMVRLGMTNIDMLVAHRIVHILGVGHVPPIQVGLLDRTEIDGNSSRVSSARLADERAM